MKKIIASIAALITILFITLPAAAQSNADSVQQAIIKVSNLHCNNDMPTIKKQLLNQDGIEDVSFTGISGDVSVFTINYHTSAISRDQIEKAIESTPGCDDKRETPYKVKKEGSRKKKKS